MSVGRKTVKKLSKKDAVLDRAEQILADPAAVGIDLLAEYQILAENYRKLHHNLHKTLIISDSYQQEIKLLADELEETLQSFQKLKELALPICMVCHKIRTTNDYWERLEDYFGKHADIMFSHGICPECIKLTYGKLGEKVLAKQKAALPATLEQPSSDKAMEAYEDDSLKEMRDLLERAVSSDNPLTPDIEKIVKRHAKLLKRFDKIVSLSDSYQLQLREFNLRLELMARTDPLTCINNRGYFMELLNTEMNRAERYGRSCSVLMIDLDHFKSVNDTYGHGAGDEALRTVARVLQASELRNSDFFGRIGGEEFVLALPETVIGSAAEVAERILVNLANTAVRHDGGEFFISASIGASEYRNGDTKETLLNRADQAMYRAKESGRNRVCLEP